MLLRVGFGDVGVQGFRDVGFGDLGPRDLGIWGLWSRSSDLGFRVQGVLVSGFRDLGFGF